MFEIISQYFWAVAIVVTCINVAIFKVRSTRHIQANPKLAKGYSKLLRGYIIWMNIPWVVMGIGCTVGEIPTFWHYFRPKDGNPYVLAWFASVFLLWIVGTYWLLFRDGADMLAKHPGAFNMKTSNPTMIKLFWFLSLAGGVFGMIMMWTLDIPVPPIP